jgi:hypothetical protein
MKEKLYFRRVQMLQEGDEILQAAAQAVDAPGHYDVELSSRGVLVQLVESRTLVTAFGAAEPVVLVDLDNLVPHALGGGAKLAFLVVRGLFERADAKVEGGAYIGKAFCSRITRTGV